MKPKTSSDKVFNVTIALLVRNWGDWTFTLTKEFQPNSEFQLLKDVSAAIDLFSTVLIVFSWFSISSFAENTADHFSPEWAGSYGRESL